jgi:L-proline amide hydrolase
MSVEPSSKATVAFGDYRTWYRITGDLRSGRAPLVVLHGGPGSTHDYLRNLAGLAKSGRPVVHYDQLGNGGSTHLAGLGPDFWTPELFLAELDNLLTALGIADGYLLFGHSWGGVLAAQHASARPAGLRGLVIANSPASYPLWRTEMLRLRDQLPGDINEILTRHEQAGTTDSAEYLRAMKVFNSRHVCRLDPLPRDFVASLMEIQNDPTVYYTMNGPSEFHVNGTLRDWSVVDCCAHIAVPTLLISGRYDEATPAAVRPFAERIPHVRWEVFGESSHLPHLEEPERFARVLTEFLDFADPARGTAGAIRGAGAPSTLLC